MKIMNIQEILAKMDSKMLAEGLSKISKGLSAEQLKEAEGFLKGTREVQGLGNVDMGALQKELQKNPEVLKKLAQNPEIIAKLRQIIKK